MNKRASTWRGSLFIRLKATGKRSGALVVLCLFMAASGLTACQNNYSESFPQIPSNIGHTDTSDPDETDQNHESTTASAGPDVHVDAELVVAVPFGQDALEMLRLYFLAEQSGLLIKNGDPHFGQQISLSDLQAFDGPLKLTLKTVSLDQGAQADDLALWTASASLPDILYGLHDQGILHEEHFLDLTPYLADYPDLTASSVYGSLLDAGRSGYAIYGIPYLASIPLIYADYSFLISQQADIPDTNWSWYDFLVLSSDLQGKLAVLEQDLSPERIAKLSQEALSEILPASRVVLADPLPMMAWLPALADEQLSWMAWSDGRFQMDHPAVQTSWAFISDYVDAGYTPYHLNNEEQSEAGFDRPLAANGRALLWIDSSAALSSWHQQDRFEVITFFLPAGLSSDLQNEAEADQSEGSLEELSQRFTSLKLPIDVRLLSVSRNSQFPDTAAALAAMIALDSESLLIQSRYQLYEGYFPVVQNEFVWTAMVGRQIYGNLLFELRERLFSVLINGGMLTNRQKLTDSASAAWHELLENQRRSQAIEDIGEDNEDSDTDTDTDPAEPTDSETVSEQPDVPIDDPVDETMPEDPRSAAEILEQLGRDLNRIRGD